MNLYIESIEGGTYIAGIGEEQADEMLKDSYRGSASFQSLSDIKQQVAGKTFGKVWLKQSTPYDEMCGSDEGTEKLMLELEWR